ncbi:uncharacterized protein LOC119576708 [Penaeus monodon]|uniref:uncharacterized protein LOC119576708 n=1 Tax=Penaeus monodon TaxID=6687 RepID=UPI0018A77F37|nr:uncharacterized protein LOC119576708 [Penaeus monodon]
MAWKVLGSTGIDRKCSQKLWRRKRFKNKGVIEDSNNDRGINLTLRILRIWKRITDKPRREKESISVQQFGFIPGRSITDAIFALRQLMGKYREGHIPKSQTMMQCAAGTLDDFEVAIGLHQGSALSPFLFAILKESP